MNREYREYDESGSNKDVWRKVKDCLGDNKEEDV